MKITVLLFATLKEHAGASRLALALPGEAASLRDVRAALAGAQPALAPLLPSAVAAVNQDFAFDDLAVKDGDEVAFFPPVSGGAPGWPEICRVAHEPISLDEITRAVTTPETGAVCIFSGAVRGETRSDDEAQAVRTAWLEYEAYEPMALAKMGQVVAEIREKWPLVQGVAVVQRVGRLDVSEPTVLIACAAAHRDQGCFEAARYGIDRLKQIVPVWKKEVGPDGAYWVEGDYHPAPGDRESES